MTEEATDNKPLVSVVLTSYNYEGFVWEAIKSVFQQTWRPLELIIVDDGSSDRSREVISAAVHDAPVPVKTVFQENSGQAAAMNAGFALAGGKYVAFLDSDDVWKPERLARMAAFAANHPDGGVYQHPMGHGPGGRTPELLVSGDIAAKWKAAKTVNTAIRHDLFLIFSPTSGLFFEKRVLDGIFPLPVCMRACPDTFIVFQACVQGPLYSLPEVLGEWRSHDANAGKQSRFGFRRFGVPVVLPAINERFQAHEIPIRLVYQPWAVLLEPFRLIREAIARRRSRGSF